MFKRLLVLLVIVIGFLFSAILVMAQAPPRKPSAILEVGTSSSCTYHNIGAAIVAANPGDTIKVENNVFTETLSITKDLTIIGGYMKPPYACLTLTGVGYGVLQGNAGSPTIRVENNAHLRLEWFIVASNTNGSAVVVDSAALDAENIIIRNNTATEGGGVHLVNATARLTDTSITNNQATRGGAIYAANSILNGDNLTLQGNKADDDGGALWVGQNSRIWLGNKTHVGGVVNSVDANYAGKTGGAVYAENGAAVIASNAVFEANYAWDKGNGICITDTATFTAENETIIARHVAQGGWGGWLGSGIFASGSGTRAVIDHSYVLTNIAITSGGGLYLENGASAIIQNNSEIRGNRNYGFVDGGAGVYLDGAQTHLMVAHSSIYTNSNSSNGGGIYNNGGVVELQDANIFDNHTWDYGGGIYNSGILTANQTIIVDNYVQYRDGGGLAVVNGVLNLSRSVIADNNAAGGQGGGVWAQGNACGVTPCLDLNNNFIVDNKSGSANSSAIYVDNTIATFIHNTLAQQASVASYGLVVTNSAGVELANNIISDFSTGIHEAGGASASVAYTNFYNNATDYSGNVTSSYEIGGNPDFVGGGDYHIQETSAAKDTGTGMGVTVDYDGDFRPQGGGYDIGADEYELPHIFLPLILK